MTKQREYELIILVHPQLEEADRKQTIEDVQKMVTIDESEENKLTITPWGKRQLAYPIDDLKEAYYVLIEGPINGQEIREYERSLIYNDNVIRHMFVRKETA